MPYTVEDYKREVKEEVLASMTPEDMLSLLKRLPPEERLKRLPPKEILNVIPPEEILKELTREEVEAYLQKLSS